MTTISGTVKDSSGAPSVRKVRAFSRSTGYLLGETTSASGTGAFSITVPYKIPCTVVAYDETGDPYWDDVSFYAPFNTSISDVRGATLTPMAGVSLITTDGYASNSCANLDGSTNGSINLGSTAHTALTLGTGDFTVETKYKSTGGGTSAQTKLILATGSVSAWGVFTYHSWANAVGLRLAGGVHKSFGAFNVNDGVWHDIAISRVSGTAYLYIDGVYKGSINAPEGATPDGANAYFGYDPQWGGYLACKLAHFRVTKGVGRYTDTTPPVLDAAFPQASGGAPDENAVLLDNVVPT